MKTLTATLLTVLALSSTAAVAGDMNYQAADNSKASELCVTAATGSPIQLLVTVRDYHQTNGVFGGFKWIANNVTCNGQYIGEFAKQAGNEHAADQFMKFNRGSVQIRDIAFVDRGTVILN